MLTANDRNAVDDVDREFLRDRMVFENAWRRSLGLTG
jgi:hypothetical protein